MHLLMLDAWASLAIYNTVVNKPVIGISVTLSHCQAGTFPALKPLKSKSLWLTVRYYDKKKLLVNQAKMKYLLEFCV